MQNNWIDIVKEALELAVADSGKAVTGAKLRAGVARIAKNKNLDFPPPELKKFADFIRLHPDLFDVKWRPGHDVLIAPQGRAELFELASNERIDLKKRIREDFFDALTKVFSGKKSPFYLPTTDSVSWLDPRDGAPPALSLPLPQSSKETELEVRRDFLRSFNGSDDAKAAIAKSLEKGSEFKPFTEAIHSNGLFEEWHSFRFEYLTKKLKLWAEQNGVAWQDNWIVSESQNAHTATIPVQPTISQEKKSLVDFLSSLNDEEVSRINVPLDIVLKIISLK